MRTRGTFRAKVDAIGHGQVFINEMDISHIVSEFVVKAKVGGVNTVALQLIGVDLDLEIEADLETGSEEVA